MILYEATALTLFVSWELNCEYTLPSLTDSWGFCPSTVDFIQETGYDIPLGDAVNFPKATGGSSGGISQAFFSTIQLTDAYYGSVPVTLYVGSTMVFEG